MTARSPRGRSDAPTRIRNAYGEFAVIPKALVRDTGLSDGAVRLYALLWDYSNESDREAWPSRASMASDLDVSVDTIDRRVRELVGRKAIAVDYDFAGDRQTSNVYTILQLEADEVVHRGRKFAAGRGRTDAAPGGRTDAAPIEPEPEEPENYSPVRQVTTDGPVENPGTGPAITPRTLSATHGKALDPAVVRREVAIAWPATFTDQLIEVLAGEILAKAPTRVIDPTGYVIAALRNPEDKLLWFARIYDLDVAHHHATLDTAAGF